MKRFNVILIFLFLVFPAISCPASDWSVNAKGGMYFPTDNELQGGKYIQAELQWKKLYVFGQWTSDMERRIAGQRAGLIDIYGIGFGVKFPISQYVKAYGQIGYYFPKSELEGKTSDWNTGYYESHWLYWRSFGQTHGLNCDGYTIFEYKIRKAIGAAIGLNIDYPLSRHLAAGLDLGYQFLRFQETFYARHPLNPQLYYAQTRQEKDFGGFNLGINLTWRF